MKNFVDTLKNYATLRAVPTIGFTQLKEIKLSLKGLVIWL